MCLGRKLWRFAARYMTLFATLISDRCDSGEGFEKSNTVNYIIFVKFEVLTGVAYEEFYLLGCNAM
jgi:hypothetical protein